MPINIAILDDHPLLIKGLKTMLESTTGITVSASFHAGRELIRHITENTADVLLLDIHVPDMNGIELLSLLNKKGIKIPAVFFTNLESRYYIKAAMETQAAGYVLKSSNEDILLQAIHTAISGGRFFDPAIQHIVNEVSKKDMRKTRTAVILSKRETEILQYIAENMTSVQIAEILFISKRTVDFHRMNLLLKLDVTNAPTLIKKALELGIIK